MYTLLKKNEKDERREGRKEGGEEEGRQASLSAPILAISFCSSFLFMYLFVVCYIRGQRRERNHCCLKVITEFLGIGGTDHSDTEHRAPLHSARHQAQW
jgi:hypothetical protein